MRRPLIFTAIFAVGLIMVYVVPELLLMAWRGALSGGSWLVLWS